MIWTIVCFLVVLFVLKRYAFGPIQQMIDTRRERIEQAIAEADNARDEARNAARGAPQADRPGEERVGGDPRRGAAPRRRAARPRQAGDRGGPPAAARGDAPPDRAGDRAGARADPRRGRQAVAARGREDHAQVAHRRRPAAADRRGARRDRLLGVSKGAGRSTRSPHLRARAVRGGAGAGDARRRAGAARRAPRGRRRRVDELRLMLENPEVDSRVKQDVLAQIAAGSRRVRRQLRASCSPRRAAPPSIARGRRRVRRARRRRAAHPRRRADDGARAVRRRSSSRFSAASSRPRAARCRPNGKVDPDLIGGLVLQAGSMRLDASVRGRLERLRHDLTHARS